MILRLIQIGNSKGIRIPKKLIEQFDFSEEIELVIKEEGLMLRNKNEPRAGWQREIFEEIKKSGPPELLIPDDLKTGFDDNEWQW